MLFNGETREHSTRPCTLGATDRGVFECCSCHWKEKPVLRDLTAQEPTALSSLGASYLGPPPRASATARRSALRPRHGQRPRASQERVLPPCNLRGGQTHQALRAQEDRLPDAHVLQGVSPNL